MKPSKCQLHFEILSTVGSLESWDLAKRSGLMDNTSNKYVKYLRDEGHNILTEGVPGKGNCKYTYISGPNLSIDPEQELLDGIELALSDYPEGHIERLKIEMQREMILSKRVAAA